MLLRPDPGAVVAIGQPAHAWLSGQLARAWGNERFGAVEPFEEVCLAAEQHDVGMAEWDLRPTLNPDTGRPHGFTELPLETHLALWSAAPGRMLAQSPYAALLVSLHGSGLYSRRPLDRLDPRAAAQIERFLAAQSELQRRLAAALGEDAERLARNRRLVAAWDHLSLACCLDWAPTTIERVPSAGAPVDVTLVPGAGALTLDPWPFGAERVELCCDGRRLAGRYSDEATLHEALDAAPWTRLRFVLIPAEL